MAAPEAPARSAVEEEGSVGRVREAAVPEELPAWVAAREGAGGVEDADADRERKRNL